MEREYKARGKKAHKMTHDGLVERDLATGEEVRVSQRGQDFQLRMAQTPGGAPSGEARQTDSVRQTASVRQAIADHAGRERSGHPRRQPPPTDTMRDSGSAADIQNGGMDEVSALPLQHTEAPAPSAPGASPFSEDSPRDAGLPSDHEPRRPDRRDDDSGRFSEDPAHLSEPLSHHDPREASPAAAPPDAPRPADRSPDTGRHSRGGERPGRLRFDGTEKTATAGSKARQHGTQYQRKFTTEDTAKTSGTASDPVSAPAHDTTASPDGSRTSDEPRPADCPDSGAGDGKHPDSSGSARKKSKLEFSKDETPPGADTPNKKVEKARTKAEKSAAKLEDARKKLPTRRRVRLNREFDTEKGKAVRKFRFEEEITPQRAHVKGPLPLRPVKAGANAAIGYAHKKIHEVEHENVGVEAAHKGELVAEGAMRRAYHMHKTRPYRRVRKLQKKATKRAVNHAYQKALAENPKLKSNVLSRMMQKRKIKRQYAKAAREAKRAGQAVQKAGSLTAKLTRAVVGIIRRHPVVFGILALILLLMFLIMGFFSSCSNMAAGGLSSIVASSYLAEDADIDNAELFYTEWETDLQLEIMNAEADHPGYDEYRYSVDDIGHIVKHGFQRGGVVRLTPPVRHLKVSWLCVSR